VLVVLEDADAAVVEQQRQAAADGPRVEVIDRRSYETMQRLAGAGALPSSGQGQELFRSDRLAASAAEQRRRRLARSAEVLGAAERKLRMALLRAEGSEPSSMCNAPANCRRGLTTHTRSGSGVPPRHRCRSASMTDTRRERPGARTARTSSSLLAHEHRKKKENQVLTIPGIAGSNPGLPATPSQSPRVHKAIPPIARNAAGFGAISGRSSFAVT
jgi:hypothetical protein